MPTDDVARCRQWRVWEAIQQDCSGSQTSNRERESLGINAERDGIESVADGGSDNDGAKASQEGEECRLVVG